MLYGYARVSTKGQERHGNGLEAQREQLMAAGCSVVIEEAFTGTVTERPKLSALLALLSEGDTLVVCKLDRIARSTVGGCTLVRSLVDRGVSVRVLNMGTLDSTPVGKMMVSVMFAMAEFERDMIVQRTQEGKAIARTRPGYREGRPRLKVDMALFREHVALVDSGSEELSVALAAVGVGRTKWYELRRETAA